MSFRVHQGLDKARHPLPPRLSTASTTGIDCKSPVQSSREVFMKYRGEEESTEGTIQSHEILLCASPFLLPRKNHRERALKRIVHV